MRFGVVDVILLYSGVASRGFVLYVRPAGHKLPSPDQTARNAHSDLFGLQQCRAISITLCFVFFVQGEGRRKGDM